ncbi:MAG: DUF2586 domain-containing protein [Bacteroidales bacterium]|jgi:hypothetical protein|nr:DUF2586 domain-containing protein [Bacteroidales bacterium]
MALNDINFIKGNGGIGRQAASEDPISGLIMSLSNLITTGLTAGGFDTAGSWENAIFVAKLKYPEQLSADYGIIEQEIDSNDEEGEIADKMARNAIVYHVYEFFRMSPTGTLFLGLTTTDVSGTNIRALQYYAAGTIRQIGILTPTTTGITTAILADYQQACTGTTGATGLEQEHQPLSLIITWNGGISGTTLASLSGNGHSQAGRQNLSLLIGCDLDPALYAKIGALNQYGCIGNVLGAISKAAVNECIGWVAKFPVGLVMPGFITGDLLKDVTTLQLNQLNDARYIFVLTHVGDAGNYYNDSFTLDVATSDYAFIENVRTMDKATRGIRTYLLPELNSPIYVDPVTGKMRADVVASIENIAGKALEDMEKAGELSGWIVEIDPDQNVLATSTVEIQIKQVPVGVMRKVNVKISYTTKLN